MNIFKKLFMALSYVTTLPTGKIKPQSEEDLKGLAGYLPWVGLILGTILSAVSLAFIVMGLDDLLGSILLGVLWLCLTGSIHMDGLMDTADGVFSHQPKERMLEIMKDSRVGNFGVLTGVCVLLIKIAAIKALWGGSLPVILLIAPIWGRLAEVFAIAKYPYAREDGKGKVWHDSTKFPKDVLVSSLMPFALSVGLILTGQYYVITFCVLALILGPIISAYLARVIGGHTGDTYGAVVELCETNAMALLVIFSAFIGAMAQLSSPVAL